jgi:peptidoglycan/LPS O-acetylase OafA/YrhL
LRKEFVLLDAFRFLAALCVLVFHYEIFALKNVANASRQFGGLDAAVDFFFILSGFVIAHSSSERVSRLSDYRQFLIRRIGRIYPLHLITLGLAVLMALAAAAAGFRLGEAQRYDLAYLPANLAMTHAWGLHDRLTFNIVSWSISVEWFLYLTFPATLFLARALRPAMSLLLVVVWFVAMHRLQDNAGIVPWHDRTYQFAMIRAVPTFFLGIVLCLIWRAHLADMRLPPQVACTLFAAAVAMMWWRAPSEALVLAFAAIVITGAMADCGERGDALVALGNASYGLYMWHHLVGIGLFAAVNPKSLAAIASTVAAATVLSIVGAFLSYRFIERPLQLSIARRLSGARAQPAV